MYRVGDVVRLNRGWTPMIVLHISDNGELWAVYARRDPSFPITRKHYSDWRNVYSYHRPCKGFKPWDGEPINTEWNYLMPSAPRRYRTIKGPELFGTYMNTTSNGYYILELDSGVIKTFNPKELEEDIPETFRVKGVTNNNYSCHYVMPNGVALDIGDILISDSHNLYIVTALDTGSRNAKGIFKGRLILTAAL